MTLETTVFTRLTIIAVSLSLIGGSLAWLDSRHEPIGVVNELEISIVKTQLERIEYEITAVERDYREVTRAANGGAHTTLGKAQLVGLKARRERLLRKREDFLLQLEKARANR